METSWNGIAVAAAITILLGVLLTQPVELREKRWQRIGMTLPFTCWIGNALALPNAVVRGIYSFFALFLVGFIWRDVFAHYLADQFIQTIAGFSKQARGVDVDLQYVKSAIRFGELERALELLREELEKDPCHYEALLLQATLNSELKRWQAAIDPLKLLLEKGRLTDEQREFVAREKKKLEDTLLVEQLNARLL